jgi:hypothetical protein
MLSAEIKEFLTLHTKASKYVDDINRKCTHIFRSGKNKGKSCDQIQCKRHKNLIP